NCGIHQNGFMVLRFRNSSSESPGILIRMNRDFQKALPLSISVLTILAQSWKNNPHKLTCPNKGLSFHVGKMKVRTPGVGRDADGSICLWGF
uniref:hypothetical protein n=1 Tax=Faecalicatena contorta TaxID=39482 RepID=UPI00359C100C